MAKKSLAVTYRPKTFEDLCGQEIISAILQNQIRDKSFQHAYLFTGPAGCGKTTVARIFASMINEGKGNPIEIDAASNSGVDNIRKVIGDSKKKSLDSKYKIYIVDECHSLSNGAWQAMLKLLEEPPAFSIFILCTTDPQKIPATILSRVQRFNFSKIDSGIIHGRLEYIRNQEGVIASKESLDYITRRAKGGMRDAITLLDKCLSIYPELDLNKVLEVLGAEDINVYFDLTHRLLEQDKRACLIIDRIYNSGKDLKLFLNDYARFLLDCEKYYLFHDTVKSDLDIPPTEENLTKINDIACDGLFDVSEMIFKLLPEIKWSGDVKTIVELSFMIYTKGKIDA